jgi:acyl-CoA reductase-like NAD-dependent aldehyde dehydrogenase
LDKSKKEWPARRQPFLLCTEGLITGLSLHAQLLSVQTLCQSQVVDPNMPFGDFKQSGIGREHGRGAIEAYTECKSICIAY